MNSRKSMKRVKSSFATNCKERYPYNYKEEDRNDSRLRKVQAQEHALLAYPTLVVADQIATLFGPGWQQKMLNRRGETRGRG